MVLGLANIHVRKGKSEALAVRMRERLGIELPRGPYRAAAADIAVAGMGRETWLATQENGGNAFAISLRETIGDLASIADQTDAYVVLRLAGPSVRDTLSKLVPVDVHSRAFKAGDVATTVAGHITVTLWRLEDGEDGSPIFEIAVFRSFAESFQRLLASA